MPTFGPFMRCFALPLSFSILVSTVLANEGEAVKTWTDRSGQKFSGDLVAADGIRATIHIAGRGKTVVLLSALSADDARHVREWRRENVRAPLIDVEAMPLWPMEAVAEGFDVRIVAEDRASGSTHYESPHFAIASDLRLPTGIVRDLAAVFEATRAAVIAAPLGLHSGIDPARYPIRLFSKTEDYTAAGAPIGSGGFYNGREMLLLLPNLGIQSTTNGLSAEHQKHLFVLKHEVSHQLMGRWTAPQPVWLGEGMAEIFAAAPYTRGRYAFQNMESALQAYLLKWRSKKDARSMRLIAPARLMSLTSREWQEHVAAQQAYDLYNSAALLTYWFIRYDGRGDGAGLAGYFDALRRRVPSDEAVQQFLVRGRTPEQLAAELRKLARKMALEVTMDSAAGLGATGR